MNDPVSNAYLIISIWFLFIDPNNPRTIIPKQINKIEILVCSAGIAGPTYSTWVYPVEEWSRVFDVNVNGVFYCNKHVVKTMREKGYGRIINIASIAGKEGNPNASAYSASKAAVIGLT